MKTWNELLVWVKQKEYFNNLLEFVAEERLQGKSVYPAQDDVFNAFILTPINSVRVVILGQDPYHGEGQAHGLSFSVTKGNKIPPSLTNMFKELLDDVDGFTLPQHGDLSGWAEQGILLLNSVLTVEKGLPNSHANKGWEVFTDEVLSELNLVATPIIFVLWGNYAQKKTALITASQHKVLVGPHPSPLSAYRGFFGCKHFSTINKILKERGEQIIDWQI